MGDVWFVGRPVCWTDGGDDDAPFALGAMSAEFMLVAKNRSAAAVVTCGSHELVCYEPAD